MASFKAQYFPVKKLSHNGPAGWRCQCCNPMNCSPRRMKVAARRMLRHVTRFRFDGDCDE